MKYVTMLWHEENPIGICVFISPALSLSMRNRFFGLSGKRSKLQAKALNHQLVTLSRVVIHPSYRGAGLASSFIRRSCESSKWRWIETLAQMGNINPFFERAGFVRVGKSTSKNQTRIGHSGIYGGKKKSGEKMLVTKQTHRKSQYSEPVYFVFDNRR